MSEPKIVTQTRYVDASGEILWTEPMILSRLWAVGDDLVENYKYYTVLANRVERTVQITTVRFDGEKRPMMTPPLPDAAAEREAAWVAAFDKWIGQADNAPTLSPVQRIVMGAVFSAGYEACAASTPSAAPVDEGERAVIAAAKAFMQAYDALTKYEDEVSSPEYPADLLTAAAATYEAMYKDVGTKREALRDVLALLDAHTEVSHG